MIPSPARTLASQTNGRLSRGPASDQGKLISRRNSLKHGLTGAGVVLPDEDAAEVAQRFDDLQAQFHPATPMGMILVHRIALCSLRLERSAEQEAAHLSGKIRHARDDHDEQRQLEIARHFEELDQSPATSVRRLLRTPEGIEALIAAWLGLRADLSRTNARFWTAAHCERANLLTGRRMDEIPVSRINELSEAIWGDFGLLGPDDGADLKEPGRRAWAKARLIDLIDEEVAALRSCFEMLDHESFALDREEAPQRALFDSSLPAILARRYEAINERGMYRALSQLRHVEKEAAENPPTPQARPVVPSGSFFPPSEAPAEPEDEAEDATLEGVTPRSHSFPHPALGENREMVGNPGNLENMTSRIPSF